MVGTGQTDWFGATDVEALAGAAPVSSASRMRGSVSRAKSLTVAPIGTPEPRLDDWLKPPAALPIYQQMTRAVFLDRDGTLNRLPALGDHIRTPSQVELLRGAAHAVGMLRRAG